MRASVIIVFAFVAVLAFGRPSDFQRANIYRMTDDLIELLTDHPTLERLQARVYVARGLNSCGNCALAGIEEIEDFSRAIRLDPTYARAYVYRGCGMNHMFHATQGQIYSEEQAIADLSTAIKLDPRGMQTQAAYNVLCCEYVCELQDYPKALAVCDTAIANSPPTDARGHYHFRAWIYGKTGEHQKEAHDYKMEKYIDSMLVWSDRVNELGWQLGWIGWFAIFSAPVYFWVSRRLSLLAV